MGKCEWVQDHNSKVWHWYGCGHNAYSACGLIPISGSPFVSELIPSWENVVVCEECEEHFRNKQLNVY